jgi:hypothetical protein
MTDHDATFRDLLPRDHQRLDAMLTAVLVLVRANERRELDQHWAAYEDGVLAHLDAEETFLVPGLRMHDAALADRIILEHQHFRTLMAEVGGGLQLHIVREDQMLELARALRAHASMEQEPLYTWADTAVPHESFDAVVRRLLAGWRRGGQARAPVAVPPPPRLYAS